MWLRLGFAVGVEIIGGNSKELGGQNTHARWIFIGLYRSKSLWVGFETKKPR
jgi:hypothetical protein